MVDQVFFILSGEFDETDVRHFEDKKRKIFRRGATNSFLLAVPRSVLPASRSSHSNTH